MDFYETQTEQWFASNAANSTAGILVVARGPDVVDVWRGCGEGQKFELATKVVGPDHMVVSPHGRYLFLAKVFGSPVELFNLEDRTMVASLPNCHGPAVFSPDDRKVLFSCLGQGVRVFDVPSARFDETRVEPGDTVMSMAVDTKFERLAIGTTHQAIVARIRKNEDRLEIDEMKRWELGAGGGDWIQKIAFSADAGELRALTRGGHLSTWSIPSGTPNVIWRSGVINVHTATFFGDPERIVVFGVWSNGYGAGEIFDLQAGKSIPLNPESNVSWASYVKSLDSLVVTGSWIRPHLRSARVTAH